MNTPIPVPQAPAVPFYQSPVLRGILTVVVTQAFARLYQHYHLDTGSYGLTANDTVSWIMDVLSAAALYYAGHKHVAITQRLRAQLKRAN